MKWRNQLSKSDRTQRNDDVRNFHYNFIAIYGSTHAGVVMMIIAYKVNLIRFGKSKQFLLELNYLLKSLKKFFPTRLKLFSEFWNLRIKSSSNIFKKLQNKLTQLKKVNKLSTFIWLHHLMTFKSLLKRSSKFIKKSKTRCLLCHDDLKVFSGSNKLANYHCHSH